MIKKTKIVATIGPATENKISMEELALAGMDVVRLNFSHGNYKEHLNRINLARLVSKKINKPIAILQDLSGPKIRIGDLAGCLKRKGQRPLSIAQFRRIRRLGLMFEEDYKKEYRLDVK